ncbi:MAG: hypothetical protein IAG13_01470 [Deltaproteobacteria bacterium]|nr:hypothetical protein [Nannocystaceae bacterium]
MAGVDTGEDALVRPCSLPGLVLVALIAGAFVAADRDECPAVATCAFDARSNTPTPAPLMTLRTRAHEVAVYSGTQLGFTVLDHQGLVLAERIDEAAFAEAFPELHDQLASAFRP